MGGDNSQNIDELTTALKRIQGDVTLLSTNIEKISDVLIGDFNNPGGLVIRIVNTEESVESMVNELKHQSSRIRALEEWVDGIKNKAIGVSIGLSLGSASVGALVSQIIHIFS